jgi:hypothetical protein
MHPEDVIQLVASVMRLLLKGEYQEVERLTRGRRYPADELKRAMESHYEKLVMPPSKELGKASVTAIQPTLARPAAWAVTADFWTEGNGVSDLSLECTVYQSDAEARSIQIDNLHVM